MTKNKMIEKIAFQAGVSLLGEVSLSELNKTLKAFEAKLSLFSVEELKALLAE